MRVQGLFWLASLAGIVHASPPSPNSTYTNPILPGWNSDPSCVSVNDTIFCTTSSFAAFPGVPVYASKDLVNWKLASNALSRPEQVPEMAVYPGNDAAGMWASTLRHRDGVFYLITAFVTWVPAWGPKVLLFSTTDPYDDAAWGDPVQIENPANVIDPDIFWDTDGKAYMSLGAGIYINEIDTETGAAGEPTRVWNGTGDRDPEGPHIFHKDDYYYLLIGEGGNETNHSAVIARGDAVLGPYQGYENNPILTAKNTNEYFQTLGHADFFQDAAGNWWGVALATRSGPEWKVYPMGRETVLFPVTWEDGEWPVMDRLVHGTMEGPLPPVNKDIPGDGHWITDPDVVDFKPGSVFPKHWLFWRPPKLSLFEISPKGHRNTLRITPSSSNLTAAPGLIPQEDGLGFIARRQSSTIFDFTVDVSFNPDALEEEAGVALFLTHTQHIDLGIVNLPSSANSKKLVPHFRFRAETSGKPASTQPETIVTPVPRKWLSERIRLTLSAVSDTKYVFGAAPASRPRDFVEIARASAELLSGGSGPFTGM